MAEYLQSEFNKFHDSIKLNDIEDNKKLREKRDMLINELKEYLKKKSDEDENFSRITFSIENQGSYSMGTGNKPLDDEDYDIDVMILFNISKDEYSPLEVKKWVYNALDKQFRTVKFKKPCVRVQYHKDGEELFHVDLALYANDNSDDKTYLSRGKPTSAAEDKKWEVANPKLLKEKINSQFSDVDERSQMKRNIRYLKRWKDFKFKNTGDGKPTGIALTALAYNLFKPQIVSEAFDSSVKPNDLLALKNLVSAIINEFDWSDSIQVSLPVEPFNNLFEKMTNNQQKTFKEKLESLELALQNVTNEPDPHEASKILRKQFGDDFPEMEKDKYAEKRALAFPGKSESA